MEGTGRAGTSWRIASIGKVRGARGTSSKAAKVELLSLWLVAKPAFFRLKNSQKNILADGEWGSPKTGYAGSKYRAFRRGGERGVVVSMVFFFS